MASEQETKGALRAAQLWIAQLQADYQATLSEKAELEQQLREARDIIRRLYGSFRWEVYTDPQETACKDAENFLGLPKEQRRDWEA